MSQKNGPLRQNIYIFWLFPITFSVYLKNFRHLNRLGLWFAHATVDGVGYNHCLGGIFLANKDGHNGWHFGHVRFA